MNSNYHLLTLYSCKQSIFNSSNGCYCLTATPGAMTQRRVNLSSEEDNAIRYASGFVATKLLKKYEDMKGEKAAQFVECRSNMGSSGDDASFY